MSAQEITSLQGAEPLAVVDILADERYAALLTGNVENLKDEDGRPVGEVRASAAAREGVHTELKRCPYPGTRKNHACPMNVSALQQTARDWPQILGALDFVRTVYRRRHPAAAPNLVEYWRLVSAMSLLVAFVHFRAEDPIADGRLPAFGASINKMVGGIMGVCSKLALQEMSEGRPVADVTVTPQLLLEAAETTDSLIGSTEVCAGPTSMLAEILDVLSNGSADASVDRTKIRAILPDPSAFLDYAESVSELTLVLFVLSLELGASLFRIERVLEGALTPTTVAAFATVREKAFFGHYTLGMPMDPEHGSEMASEMAPLLRTDVRAICRLSDRPDNAIDPAILVDLRARWPHGIDLAPPQRDALLEELALHLTREWEAVRMIETLRAATHVALGRAIPTERLAGADLSRLFGFTTSDFFRLAFDFEVSRPPAAAKHLGAAPYQAPSIPVPIQREV